MAILTSIVNLVRRPRADVNSTATWGALNASLSTPTNTGGHGERVFRATGSGAGAFGQNWPTTAEDRPQVIPGQNYLLRTKAVSIPATRLSRLSIEWYDKNHVILSTTFETFSANLGERRVLGKAPTGADHVLLTYYTDGGAAAEILQMDGFFFAATDDINEAYGDGNSLFWQWQGDTYLSRSQSIAVAQELYSRLAPLAFEDAQNSFALAHLLTAFIGGLQEQENLARDRVVAGKLKPGWSVLFDLKRIPDKAVPWLAQFVGVTAPKIAGESDQAYAYRLKPLIEARTGWQRGTPAAIATAAGYWLTGQKRVTFRERTPTPYTVQIRTLQSETPNQAAVIRQIKAVKPGGIVLDYAALPGQDWTQLNATYASWSVVNSTFPTWDHVRTSWP